MDPGPRVTPVDETGIGVDAEFERLLHPVGSPGRSPIRHGERGSERPDTLQALECVQLLCSE